MRRLLSLTLLASSLIVTSAVTDAEEEPERRAAPVRVRPSATTSTTEASTTTEATTTTTLPPTTTVPPLEIPEGAKCGEWWQLAKDVGWPEDRLPLLGRIMWNESRCLPDVKGAGSYGLAQMQYSAHHEWMSAEFGIENREELYDPALNLLTALWLAEYAEQHYGCWAQPWYMSGDWC
jgi:hypothetical protein